MKTVTDYVRRGLEYGLQYKGPLPRYTTDKTNWVCLRCKTSHQRSYSDLGRGKYGCPCRRSLPDTAYTDLAENLGIEWLGPPVKNVYTDTEWRIGEVTVQAPYRDLFYEEHRPRWVRELLSKVK